MLIKKHQLPKTPHSPQHQTPGHPEDALAEATHSQPEVAEEMEVPVNAESIQQGLAEDRRMNKASYDDRRRGYRRIEDRHLISKAHEEARQIKETAFEEGFEKGMMMVTDEIDALKQQFEALLVTRTQALSAITDDIAPIAVEIAERLIKVELSCDEDLVNTIVEDTLQKLDRHSKTVLIKVNPNDKARVRAFVQEHPPTHLKAEIMVIDDTTVDAGGCVVETDSGLIDASFRTRLTILKEMFGTYQPAPKSMPTAEVSETIIDEIAHMSDDSVMELATEIPVAENNMPLAVEEEPQWLNAPETPETPSGEGDWE